MAFDAMRVYFRCIGASLRGEMQHRVSFALYTLAAFGMTCVEFFAIWALFDHFGALKQWRFAEVGLCCGMSSCAFALAGLLARGFDRFDLLVQTGEFDRILLRPRTTVMQLFGREWYCIRLSRLTQGLLVLAGSAACLDIAWSAGLVAVVFCSIFAGMLVFIGLFILQATMCFWTVQTLEIMNCVTDGGNYAARVPLTVYRPWMRWFFTIIVPLACVNLWPLEAVTGRTTSALAWCGPAVGAGFFAVCLSLWRLGVRRYRSTGS
ncbi:MAG: ABC-2 family transporter protein [Phycisphaeraceae bacterium]|nr:ABC-2 family transporter protein [Phycisphaeraceae bacterium]